MKRNIRIALISLIAISLSTSCIGGLFTDNISGCIRADADEICTVSNPGEADQSDFKCISRQLIVLDKDNIKEMLSTLSYLPELVRKNDDQYISNIEKSCNIQYEFRIDGFYKNDSDVIQSLKLVWGIEDGDYLMVVGRDKNQNPEDIVQGDLITYFVDINTGSIIIIPAQGGMESYSIKDNQIIKVYNDLLQSSSYKWR